MVLVVVVVAVVVVVVVELVVEVVVVVVDVVVVLLVVVVVGGSLVIEKESKTLPVSSIACRVSVESREMRTDVYSKRAKLHHGALGVPRQPLASQ